MDTNQEYLTSLLHFDGSNGATTIPDTSKTALNSVCVGTCALSTAQKQFGTASLKTGSANGNYLKLGAGKTALDFGSSDFTVEAWVWPVSQGADYGAIFGRWDDASSNKDWLVWRAADGSVNVSINGSQVVTGAAGDLPTVPSRMWRWCARAPP